VRLGVVLILVAALLPVAAVASSSRTARVTVPATSPVSVHGTNFRSKERVTVTFSAKGIRTKTVTANARGGFWTTFRGLTIGSCDFYTVRARGNRGSSAFLKVIPECAPQAPSGEPER
jgi:hypothetical protein